MTLCFVLLLSACGFHLRGTSKAEQAPLPFDRLYIDTPQPYGRFNKDLVEQLRAAGVSVVASRNNAPATLVILSEKDTQRTLSVGGNGQTQRIILNKTVTYELRDPKGHRITEPNTAKALHFLTLTQDEMLGSNNDKMRYQAEMGQMCVRQLLTQLRSPIVMRYFQSSLAKKT